MWVAEDNSLTVTAWNLDNGDRIRGSEFNLPSEIGLIDKKALWSYGPTLWVTSAAKQKVYAVNLFSNDSTLSALTVGPDDIIGFNPRRSSYAVGLAATVTTATITATPTDGNATMTFGSQDVDTETDGHQVHLSPGRNRVAITVTAEDKVATTVYSVSIGRGVEDTYGWKAVDDLDGLIAVGNLSPFGIWGDDNTHWVADFIEARVFAYNRDGTRDSSKEFPLHSDNGSPTGIWSDGAIMWVADAEDAILYAYQLSDGTRLPSRYITLDPSNSSPGDIWSKRDYHVGGGRRGCHRLRLPIVGRDTGLFQRPGHQFSKHSANRHLVRRKIHVGRR